MARQDNAFLTPATVLGGMAIHELISSFYILFTRKKYATVTWIISFITAVLLTGFVFLQLYILDYQISPYPVPNYWYGLVSALNYTFAYIISVFIIGLLLHRVRVFYGKSAVITLATVILGVLTLFIKGFASGVGAFIGYQIAINKYLSYSASPNNDLIYPTYAAACVIEAGLFIAGSFSFLYVLSISPEKKWYKVWTYVSFDGGCSRIILIMITNVVLTISAVSMASSGRNYINTVGLYIPSFLYGLELHSYLFVTFRTTQKMIESQSKSKAQSSTHKEDPIKIEIPTMSNKSKDSQATLTRRSPTKKHDPFINFPPRSTQYPQLPNNHYSNIFAGNRQNRAVDNRPQSNDYTDQQHYRDSFVSDESSIIEGYTNYNSFTLEDKKDVLYYWDE
ncbi:hypothetical protein HK103_005376 [Boothiomyces macroporosus]|uniref:Uncharacterized protein n=1 Tax=Boothiomyces macroporosus TaxID=261099 RepID=A0AAD5ULY2_9FUNG|nr:hypothetical protein HK103_005376 [Boothiomyces macroporosus]